MVDKITNPPSQKDLIDKVNELVDDKQDTLVSGTNIKTINNTSILGSGNIDIQSGGSYTAGTGIDITNGVISTANPLRVEKTDGTKTYFYKIGINNNNRLFAEYGYDIAGGGTITNSLPTSYSFSGTDIDISYGSSSGEQEYIQTVSLSIGSNIARKSDIPTVNDSTITFTQGGTTKGTITLNQSSNQTIAFDAGGSYTAGTGIDISNNTISVTSPTLTNTATGSGALTIAGTAATFLFSTNIGYASIASNIGNVAVGYSATATSTGSMAIGYLANATGIYSIQLGTGTNSEANSFYVATSNSDNWKMLGNDGLIPDARISSNIARSADLATVATSGDYNDLTNKPDLTTKADVDLSNVNASGTALASGWGMPSSRYIDLTIGTSGSTYTAPANGYFCFNGKDSSNTGTAEVVLRNQTRYFGVAGTNPNSARTPAWSGYILPVKKGDTVNLYYIGTLALNNTNWAWRFYYAEGEA